MNPLAVYQDYLALKFHFRTSYDYHRYCGKTTHEISKDSPHFVKSQMHYEKVGRHKDPHGLLLANLSVDPYLYIKDIAFSNNAQKTYERYIARQQSLGYFFKNDLGKIKDLKASLHLFNQPPPIVGMVLAEEITFETLCILAIETGSLAKWEAKIDPVIMDTCFKIRKHSAFLEYHKHKFRKIIADHFRSTPK